MARRARFVSIHASAGDATAAKENLLYKGSDDVILRKEFIDLQKPDIFNAILRICVIITTCEYHGKFPPLGVRKRFLGALYSQKRAIYILYNKIAFNIKRRFFPDTFNFPLPLISEEIKPHAVFFYIYDTRY